MEAVAFNSLVDISHSEAARKGSADLVLDRARWAASVFDRYDLDATRRIVDAVAEAAFGHAADLAEAAVEETGFGVAAHKKMKNELTSKPLAQHYRDADFVNPRIDEANKIVEIPRPAGVVFALTPSTNPVATINYKAILSLLTRNALVISPHPAARETSSRAGSILAAAAEGAGAPAGVIQVIETPTIPMVEAFMQSDKINVILATGGSAMVRAAYSSGNPAIGVGPGNAPVVVDDSAELSKAARMIVESKSFDNSVLCTNESVLIALESNVAQLRIALKASGAYLCSDDEVKALRRFLFHPNGFNVEAIGRDAVWIARESGIQAPSGTKILVAPIARIGVEEPLSKEKLCPVLALHVASSKARAFVQARAVLRLAGAGHSAAIHATDESVIMEFSSMVEVYRVAVNAPCSQGAAGIATNLAPTFTVGTGFFGRSSIGDNVGPQHLVHWTKVAYGIEERFGNFDGVARDFTGPLPAAPADGVPGSAGVQAARHLALASASDMDAAMREELRRMIVEELTRLKKR